MNNRRKLLISLGAGVLAITLSWTKPAFPQIGSNAAPVSEQRVALVIGNSTYTDFPLANPVNDATDMAQALQNAGFKVILKRNGNTRDMRQAIREFASELRRAHVGLFYFAGHGIQVKGNNYLVPVGADIQGEADVEDLAIDAGYVLRTMEEAQVKVSIVILDACRNNPFARSFRSTNRGLAQMTAATGSIVAFATAPGSVAADGTGRNGIYTKYLLESLRQADTDILKVLQRTRANVVKETGGKQTPWESTSLVGDFYFRPPSAGTPLGSATQSAAVPAPADPTTDDRAFWESVKDSGKADELHAYLEQYPNGRFAALARTRLKSLEALPNQLATTVPSTPSGGSRSNSKLEELRSRALLLGFEGAAALAHAKMGRNMEPYVIRLNAYLKRLDLAGESYPPNPWGANADGKPATDFARRIVAALGAVDSRVQRAFLVGWMGVITTTTPSLKPAGFDLRKLAHQAGLPPQPKMTEMEYVQWLAEQAQKAISVGE